MFYYTWTVTLGFFQTIFVIFDHINVVWGNFRMLSFENIYLWSHLELLEPVILVIMMGTEIEIVS